MSPTDDAETHGFLVRSCVDMYIILMIRKVNCLLFNLYNVTYIVRGLWMEMSKKER